MPNRGRGFATLARRGSGIEVLEGEAFTVGDIHSIPLPQSDKSCVIAIIPFRQIMEKGYVCNDDRLRIQVLSAETITPFDQRELSHGRNRPFRLSALRFEPNDTDYESLVADVISREIGGGAGSNFVMHRRLRAQIDTSRKSWLDEGSRQAFSYLISRDPSAYWRFWISLPELTLIGSSPELHIAFESGQVRMTPMSGTLRLSPLTQQLDVHDFIDSRKETEELFMVLDEELKMICQMNPSSTAIRGPYLDVFGNVAHTSFEIRARTTLNVHDVLLRSLLAPTVTGSPIREAFAVIARNERSPRGYYGGVLCQFRRRGQEISLDSAIAIRTAYIEPNGQVSIPVGATVVRHSDPRAEAAETTSKATGILAALRGDPAAVIPTDTRRLLEKVGVNAKLQSRHQQMSEFWLSKSICDVKEPEHRNALIVDFDDDWTSMLAYLISGFGIRCAIVGWREVQDATGLNKRLTSPAGIDLLVLGPGPGDPTDESDPRIRLANHLAGIAALHPIPTLAVCLSHQCVSRYFGLKLARLREPAQGTTRSVHIGSSLYSLAFYNSYAAYYDPADYTATLPKDAETWYDHETGELFGFRAPGITSVQFHLESVISRDGEAVANILLSSLLC